MVLRIPKFFRFRSGNPQGTYVLKEPESVTLSSIFEAETQQKQVLSNQNMSHLGSRCVPCFYFLICFGFSKSEHVFWCVEDANG